MNIKNLDLDGLSTALSSKQTVLIDFYAPWCDSCSAMNKTISDFVKDNNDIDVYIVDVEKNIDLTNLYGIMSVPTLLVIKNKKVQNRSGGYISKEQLSELLQ